MASFQALTHRKLAAERNLRYCVGRLYPKDSLAGGAVRPSFLFALAVVAGCVSVASSLYCETQCACVDYLPYYHNTSSSTGCCLGWFGQCLTCCNEPNTTTGYSNNVSSAGNMTCDGYSGTWTSPTGKFTDRSITNSSDGLNQSCWLYIQPGYNYIHLEFSRLDTEYGHDYVRVHNLDSLTGYLHRLTTFSGEASPGQYVVSSGNSSILAIQFKPATNVARNGFAAYYTYTQASTGPGLPWHTDPSPVRQSTTSPRDCRASTEMLDVTGVISDGSGRNELYVSDGSSCRWVINPGCATCPALQLAVYHTAVMYGRVHILEIQPPLPRIM